ncbi:DUF4291 domain-containing protein [Thalassoroseus pseudoceratinae]|uniref:DUF4291 domain-containing protein n=1 Tax=Thalassoroseus pseudoceratinae TaxID=2713176 RepID=UPI0014216D03|nr:DUF4291 domain-containing protein [Thalassoroseus pseudoceratinae]
MTLATHPYTKQVLQWPTSGRHILAQFDDKTIIVYQAYRPEIGHFAVTHGHFGGEFSYSRMSWIKPNFLWMMYRSDWGRSQGQEVVLAIRLRRAFFDSLLEQAVPSSFVPELFENHNAWKAAVASSDVRLQWDPDHDPTGGKCERRAIQLGLRGKSLDAYGKEEIVEIIDMSDFVARQRDLIGDWQSGKLLTPSEHVYVPKCTTAAANVGLTDWRGNSSENEK